MKTISFKVSEDEAKIIQYRARSEHLSVSEYLRRKATGSEGAAPVGKVRCEFTGAEIFGPLDDATPLTTERVRELLSDFP
jgi:hypothetical protein